MQERIKFFESRNKNNQPLTINQNRNKSMDITNKKQLMDNLVKLYDNNNDNKTTDKRNRTSFKNKSIDNNANSYARRSLKKNLYEKNNKEKNNVSIFSNLFKKNENNKPADKNNYYNNFVKNLKIGINDDTNNTNYKEDNYTGRKSKRNKKKKVLGNFLNKFVNKSQYNNELLIQSFKNLKIVCNNFFYIEASKKQNKDKNNFNNNNEIILKKELEIKERKIKELCKALEKQNDIIKQNEKLKEEIANLKNIINKKNISNNNNNKILMGCQNSNTSEGKTEKIQENQNISEQNIIKEENNNKEDEAIIEQEKKEENILIATFSGFLIKGLNFQNCLIKSQDELITNLRMFIPAKIQKKQKKSFVFNLEDKILSNSINVNFNKNYIIALTGFNNIKDIKKENGNYIIYHDGQISNEEKYIALVVKKLEGNPQIVFSPEI